MNFIIASLLMSCCIIAVANCGEYHRIDGRTYYSSYPDKQNWYQAKRYCTSNGMYLVDVRTDAENKRIRSVINQIDTKYKTSADWWTSGTDQGSEGTFYWDTTGHAMLFSGSLDWAAKQPDNGGGKEHCVHYSYQYEHKWNDASCELAMYFICRDSFDLPNLACKQNNN